MRLPSIALVLALFTSTLSPTLFYSQKVEATPPPPDLIDTLNQETGDKVTITYDDQSGLVNFIGSTLDAPIQTDLAADESLTAEASAMSFLRQYGSLFGITDPDEELTLEKSVSAENDVTVNRYQQVVNGIPVMGAEIVVRTLADRGVLSANGEFLPNIKTSTDAAISAEDAQQAALSAVSKEVNVDTSGLVASEPELWLYNPEILGGPGIQMTSLAWRMEVTSLSLAPIRYLVLVDAKAGIPLLSFNQADTALDTATYTANNGTSLPGTLVCDENTSTCSDTHAQGANSNAIATYNFYSSILGRDSIDNAGMQIISTVHYDEDYDNAFWNGSQMVYGDYELFPLADDVVAHELTHGVTENESKLFYYYQSGAINEALSDIMGEFVDLWDGTGTDTTATRWLMGEDIQSGGTGAIRDMENPPLYSQPDTMTSSYYYCGTSDNGGVHYNSGVANKAAYLMVDGGTFNGQTITGIGLEKAAHIWYVVNTSLLTSASDYADLASALPNACNGLVGDYGITSADCSEVQKAVTAVAMSTQPASCTTPVAATCSSGLTENDIFYDNLEYTSSGKWTTTTDIGSVGWSYPQNPNPIYDSGYDMTYATSGVTNMYGFDSDETGDYSIAMTKSVTLPTSSTAYFRFNHAYFFESTSLIAYDGGRVEYSLDGGAWTDAGPLIDSGQDYNSTISPDYYNPLAGSEVFSGSSYGYVSSRINLAGMGGHTIRFRFRIGTDIYGWAYGWFIDDISLYTCFDNNSNDETLYVPLTVYK